MAKTESATGKSRVVRVSLDLSEPFHRRLSDLEHITHADSKSGVIRQALQIYEYVVLKTLEGYQFRSVDGNGIERDLAFFSPYMPLREPELEPEEVLA